MFRPFKEYNDLQTFQSHAGAGGARNYTQNDLIIMHLIMSWLACIQQLTSEPLEAWYRRAFFTLRVTLLVLPLPAVSELPV